jgi:PIN domain nuclease of toxin-antitoxin system
MEIATKVRLGKFEEARPLAIGFAAQTAADGFTILDITAEHGERAGGLPLAHKDPWDRLLVAQAQIEDLLLVTNDRELVKLGAATFW